MQKYPGSIEREGGGEEDGFFSAEIAFICSSFKYVLLGFSAAGFICRAEAIILTVCSMYLSITACLNLANNAKKERTHCICHFQTL